MSYQGYGGQPPYGRQSSPRARLRLPLLSSLLTLLQNLLLSKATASILLLRDNTRLRASILPSKVISSLLLLRLEATTPLNSLLTASSPPTDNSQPTDNSHTASSLPRLSITARPLPSNMAATLQFLPPRTAAILLRLPRTVRRRLSITALPKAPQPRRRSATDPHSISNGMVPRTRRRCEAP